MSRRKPARRKKNYQSLGELQAENSYNRMAGDPLVEEALDYLANNGDSGAFVDAAMQDAMEYLPARREQLRQMRGSTTWSNLQMEKRVNDLGELQNGVPMPVIHKIDNGEERVHVKYERNPITEQIEVVPVLDPSGSGKAVRTVYGQAGIDKKYQHQAEPAMASAMRLMGYDTVNNGNSRRGAADLKGTKDGIDKRVDVMVDYIDEPSAALPLYTALVPMRANGTPVMERRKDGKKAQWVRNEIDQEMRKAGTDLYTAVEKLVDQGVIGPNDNRRLGKLLRGSWDHINNVEDMYDRLILPGYTNETLNDWPAPKKVPIAPETIYGVDLQAALDALKAGRTAGPVKKVTNYGPEKDQYERVMLKPRFKRTEENGFVDLTDQHPILQQLLSADAMRARLQ